MIDFAKELFVKRVGNVLYITLLVALSIVFIGPTLPVDLSLFVIFSILSFCGLGERAPNLAIGCYVREKISNALALLGRGGGL